MSDEKSSSMQDPRGRLIAINHPPLGMWNDWGPEAPQRPRKYHRSIDKINMPTAHRTSSSLEGPAPACRTSANCLISEQKCCSAA